MKRLLVSLFAALMLLSFACVGGVQAGSIFPGTILRSLASEPIAAATAEATQNDLMEQLKAQALPQIESILTPEQRDQLEATVVDGKTSFRKAFKSLSLTPDQKTKLAGVFKSLPKKELFTAMTPEQKKTFFMKKKELFMPTPEEISQYKAQKEK